jgi:hypothetical protein
VGAAVRVRDDFSGKIAVGAVESKVFVVKRALRFARHGRAPKGAGA